MESRIKTLLSKLEQGLEEIELTHDPIVRTDLSVKLVSTVFTELKGFIGNYHFSTVDEEITYFKGFLPQFYSKHVYFSRVYDLEVLKRTSSKGNMRLYYDQELKQVDLFFVKNNDFCKYYYSNSSYLDEKLFTRKNGHQWLFEDVAPLIDAYFTIGSYKVASIISNEKYRYYLEREVHHLEHGIDPDIAELSEHTYTWEPSKAAASEIIDGLYETKSIKVDGHYAEKKELAFIFKALLNVNLGNIYEKSRRNLQRKIDDTPFLNSMISAAKQAHQTKAARRKK